MWSCCQQQQTHTERVITHLSRAHTHSHRAKSNLQQEEQETIRNQQETKWQQIHQIGETAEMFCVVCESEDPVCLQTCWPQTRDHKPPPPPSCSCSSLNQTHRGRNRFMNWRSSMISKSDFSRLKILSWCWFCVEGLTATTRTSVLDMWERDRQPEENLQTLLRAQRVVSCSLHVFYLKLISNNFIYHE